MLEVPAGADLAIGRLDPPEAAVTAAVVPVPHEAVLAVDVIDHAVATGEDMLEVPARADLAIGRLGPPEAAVTAAVVPVPHEAVLAIDVIDQAVATGEDMLEVSARADLAVRRLGPSEAAVASAVVPVPHELVLAIDVIDQADADTSAPASPSAPGLRLDQRVDAADRRGHAGSAQQLQERSPLQRAHVSPHQS